MFGLNIPIAVPIQKFHYAPKLLSVQHTVVFIHEFLYILISYSLAIFS
jgi:hypothetical protein